MMRPSSRTTGRPFRRSLIGGLFLLGLLAGNMGAGCNDTVFRDASIFTIGEGIKVIFAGLVDGTIAGVFLGDELAAN